MKEWQESCQYHTRLAIVLKKISWDSHMECEIFPAYLLGFGYAGAV